MKTKLNKTLIGILAFMMLFSCDDKYLDEKPNSFLSPEVTYDTDEGLASGAVGLYDELSYPYWGSSNWEATWVVMNGATDFNMMGVQKTKRPLAELNSEYGPATSDGDLIRPWSHFYRMVNNATTIIQYSEQHEWQNDDQRKMTEGEAYFFRGYGHFFLTMLWGDVPTIREVVSGVKLDFTNEAQSEVLAFVIEDFKKAAELLPAVSQWNGRITKATGNHMLAYAYLAAKDYENAETAAQAAIDDPNHSLVTERFGSKTYNEQGNVFWDLFQLDNHNNNPEGLLVLQNGNSELYPQYVPDAGCCTFRGPRMLIPRYETVDGLQSSPEYGGRGFGRNSPTMGWYDLFEPQDLRFSYPSVHSIWIANEDRGDISIGDTLFVLNNPEKSMYPNDDLRLRPFPTKWNKEFDPNNPTQPHPDEMAYTGGTIRDAYLIRLAETYLILAEAQLMQGKKAEAAETINIIRRRSNASEITANDVTIDFILDEKARELWGEQISRKVDLFRTGKYVERVRKYNPDAGQNVSEKHSIIPIPQSEIDLNSDAELKQNPLWE